MIDVNDVVAAAQVAVTGGSVQVEESGAVRVTPPEGRAHWVWWNPVMRQYVVASRQPQVALEVASGWVHANLEDALSRVTSHAV